MRIGRLFRSWLDTRLEVDVDLDEIYVVLCSGHSGSRLLVRLLCENGFFMGRSRGTIGEDERRFGALLWDDWFRHHYVANWKYPGEHTKYIQNRLCKCHQQFVSDIYPSAGGGRGLFRSVFRFNPPRAVGLKNATLFPYIAEDYQRILSKMGIHVKIIHLTRNPLNWMLSGRGPNSRGIVRPSKHPRFSQLSDPFNRIVWFGDLSNQVTYAGKKIQLSDNRIYDEKEQIILEAMMWRTTNTLCRSFRCYEGDYFHLKYEDLIERTDVTLGRLGDFASMELRSPQKEKAKIRTDRVSINAKGILGPKNSGHVSNICGPLMNDLGYNT